MPDIALTRMRLADGVWEGLMSATGKAIPKLVVRHRDECVAQPEAEQKEDNVWLVRFRVPSDCLSDGVQTLVIENAETGDILAHETIVAGEVLDDDLRAEVSLLRAELDLLKRAFRRHCTESEG